MLRNAVWFLVNLYLYILIGRVIIDMVMSFNRSWRPTGVLVALVDLVFALTDPPLRLLRRFIPPLRLGAVSLDLSFLVLLLGIQILAPLLLALLPA